MERDRLRALLQFLGIDLIKEHFCVVLLMIRQTNAVTCGGCNGFVRTVRHIVSMSTGIDCAALVTVSPESCQSKNDWNITAL